MKRNVLASFTDVLLLPVTIVPRAVGAGVGAVGAIGTGVGAAIGTGVGAVGTGVVQGIFMLNPQRWVGNGVGSDVSVGDVNEGPGNGYESFGKDGALFEVGEDDELEEEEDQDVRKGNEPDGGGIGLDVQDEAGWGEVAESRGSDTKVAGTEVFDTAASSTPEATNIKSTTPASASTSTKDLADSTRTSRTSLTPSGRHSQASARTTMEKLDLLLSFDVSLQLIHATRDAIKRLETFAAYPGRTGTRVRETLEDAFCEMLGTLGARHIAWGFGM